MALLLLLGLFAAGTAQAAISGSFNGMGYSADNGEVAIVSYSGTGGGMVIPSTINVSGTDLPVTGIGANAFQSSIIEGVIIPSSVKEIGINAFGNCPSLKDAIMFPGVLRIDNYAFQNCPKLRGVWLASTVSTIGKWAFLSCPKLKSIIIPASVTSIGDYAFAYSGLRYALCLGNAPAMGSGVFDVPYDYFGVAYLNSKLGFASPYWNGYLAVPIGESDLAGPGAYQAALADNKGVIAVSLSKNGRLSGKLMRDGAAYPFKGGLDSTGAWHSPVLVGGAILSLQYHFTFDFAAGGACFTGLVDGAAFTAFHSAFDIGGPFGKPGKYTVLFSPSEGGSTVPQGYGYASLKVGETGGVRMVGRLADGEGLSASGIVMGGTEADHFFVYKSLNYPSPLTKGAKGLISGVLSFARLSGTSDIFGTLAWAKPQQGSGLYPAPISTNLNVAGARYTPPGKGATVLPMFLNGTLDLSDSNVSLSKSVTLTDKNALTVTNPGVDNLKVTISASSGLIKGSFLYPGQSKSTAFGGVLFQNQAEGAGCFLGPNGSGILRLGH